MGSSRRAGGRSGQAGGLRGAGALFSRFRALPDLLLCAAFWGGFSRARKFLVAGYLGGCKSVASEGVSCTVYGIDDTRLERLLK